MVPGSRQHPAPAMSGGGEEGVRDEGGGSERPLPALLWRQWTGPAILGSREHGQLRTRCKAVTKAWDVPRASRSQPGTTSPVSRSPRTRSRRGDPRAAFSGTSGCGSGGGVLRQSATGQTHAHPRRLGGAAGAVGTCSSEDRGRRSVGSASPRDKNCGPQVGAQSGLWWAGWEGGCGPGCLGACFVGQGRVPKRQPSLTAEGTRTLASFYLNCQCFRKLFSGRAWFHRKPVGEARDCDGTRRPQGHMAGGVGFTRGGLTDSRAVAQMADQTRDTRSHTSQTRPPTLSV